MTFVRWLIRNLSASLFSLAVFSFAFLVSLYVVFHTPKQLETALQQSGIYSVAVQDTLEQTQNNNSSLPLTDPGVQSAIQSAVPASTIQSSAEQIINSAYNWIDGRAASPNFTIDLTKTKSDIAANLGTYLQPKLAALPVCPAGTELPDNTGAIFSMACRPAGVSVSQLVSEARQEALGNGVLKDASITASTLKDRQGQPLTSKFSYVPKLRHDFMMSLYGLPALIVLSALGVTFASKSKRAGLRRLCLTLLTTGIYSLAIAWVTVWLLNHATNSLGSQAAGLEAVQGKAVKVAELLVADLRKWWFGFGIGYVGVGVLGLLALHFIKPKLRPAATGNNPLGHNMDIPQAGTTFTAKSENVASESRPPAKVNKQAADPGRLIAESKDDDNNAYN